MPSSRQAFRYLADPIFISVLGLYCLNRWLLKPYSFGGQLVHDHLNDLICLPLAVPIILRLQSLAGLRRHDRPPTAFEVLHAWFVFSVLYEVILPNVQAYRTTADSLDVIAYFIGGVIAWTLWNRPAKQRPSQVVRSGLPSV